MTDTTSTQTSDKPLVLKPKSGLSMGQQVMIALRLGIAPGFFSAN